MKTWKILLVIGLAILAVGLLATSAYAAMIQPAPNSYGAYSGAASPYGGSPSRMMRGSMMGGYGYAPSNGYAYGANGWGCCMGLWVVRNHRLLIFLYFT